MQIKKVNLLFCLKLFLVNAFVLLLVLFVIECFVRFFFPYHDSLYQYHPKYLYVTKPSVSFTLKKTLVPEDNKESETRFIQILTDSQGYREVPGSSSRASKKIVIYGDSCIHGLFSESKNTFAGQLQQKLNADSENKYSVVNAGVTGYGPDQAFLRMSDDASKLKPDAVVFAIFADNDFGDLIRNKIFSLSKAGEVSQRHYRLSFDIYMNLWAANWYIYKAAVHLLIRGLYWAASFHGPNEAVSGDTLVQKGLELCSLEYESYQSTNLVTVHMLNDHYDFDLALEPRALSSQLKLKLMFGVLQKIKNFSEDAKVPVILMIIPSHHDLTTHDPINYKILRNHSPDYQPESLSDYIEQMALKLKFSNVINLYRSFKEDGPDRLYFKMGDLHWNERGQGIAASLIKRAVENAYIEK